MNIGDDFVPNDLRLSEMLEELQDTGRSPEEVCGDFPELLPELRMRWQQVRRLNAELDLIFPPERDAPAADLASSPDGQHLPRIPGYEVESLLGRGGMGIVFRARHLGLNRVVAIKMALHGAYAAPRDRERFQREAEAVAALRHANVVQIYDVGDSAGQPFFTMEYVAGGSLADVPKPTPPREAAKILVALASALHAAHTAGIIHRDLKPANILIEEDGTPKISDFGLSRRIDDVSSLTLQGSVIGTPSYMAPEQATGDQLAVNASVDIYALGVILYELLAGRPPFRDDSPSETIRQVIHDDPVPPSRRNAKIPRDLDIICLKCLHKDPARRYASAATLAQDLRRFLDGEAIEARPEGRFAKLARRIRRRLGLSASVAIAILLSLAGIGLAIERDASQRRIRADLAATERAADDDLRDMAAALASQDWAQANVAHERARGRLGDRGGARLRAALDQGERDLKLASRLDAIRTDIAKSFDHTIDFRLADESYSQAFRSSGVGDLDEPPDVVASRVSASNIRGALVDALDIWPVAPDNTRRKTWLLATARMADRNQEGWVVLARDPAARQNLDALNRLCDDAPIASRNVPLFLALAEDLSRLGGDPILLLNRVQQAHPGDFWANVWLMDYLIEKERDDEAIRYAQAALSVRPELSIGYTGLGSALLRSGRTAEAIEPFRTATRIDADAPNIVYNLGHALTMNGQGDESIAYFRQALRTRPKEAALHLGLGNALASKSQDQDALVSYERAVQLDPRDMEARDAERSSLQRLGRFEEARLSWRAALEADPKDRQRRDGYAELCLFLGLEDEYRRARLELLARTPQKPDPRVAERVGRACLLFDPPPDVTRRATELIDYALADAATRPREWTYPYFLLAKSLSSYREGAYENALSLARGNASTALGPCPRLISAMAEHRLGRHDESSATLAEALRSYDWNVAKAVTGETWIYHILRREAERLILPAPPDRSK